MQAKGTVLTYFIVSRENLFDISGFNDSAHSGMPDRHMEILTMCPESASEQETRTKGKEGISLQRYDFYKSRWENDSCSVDMFQGKGLWDGVVL